MMCPPMCSSCRRSVRCVSLPIAPQRSTAIGWNSRMASASSHCQHENVFLSDTNGNPPGRAWWCRPSCMRCMLRSVMGAMTAGVTMRAVSTLNIVTAGTSPGYDGTIQCTHRGRRCREHGSLGARSRGEEAAPIPERRGIAPGIHPSGVGWWTCRWRRC